MRESLSTPAYTQVNLWQSSSAMSVSGGFFASFFTAFMAFPAFMRSLHGACQTVFGTLLILEFRKPRNKKCRRAQARDLQHVCPFMAWTPSSGRLPCGCACVFSSMALLHPMQPSSFNRQNAKQKTSKTVVHPKTRPPKMFVSTTPASCSAPRALTSILSRVPSCFTQCSWQNSSQQSRPIWHPACRSQRGRPANRPPQFPPPPALRAFC